MKRCAVCDVIIMDEDDDFMVLEVPIAEDDYRNVYICSDCANIIADEKYCDGLSNTVLIDGKAVEPGIYTCIWAGNREWRVIITESDIIPDEDSDDMVALLEVLAFAVEGVLDQHEGKSPETQWGV